MGCIRRRAVLRLDAPRSVCIITQRNNVQRLACDIRHFLTNFLRNRKYGDLHHDSLCLFYQMTRMGNVCDIRPLLWNGHRSYIGLFLFLPHTL